MLQELFKRKKALSDFLYDVRDDLMARAYKGAVNGKKTALLARELKDTALRYVASMRYDGFLLGDDEYENAIDEVTDDSPFGLILPIYAITMRFMRHMSFKTKGAQGRDERAHIAFEYLRKSKADRVTTQAILREMAELELVAKRNYVSNGLEKGVFFLVSKHEDSAKDHEGYQGRIYVNAKWREIVTDKADRKLVNVYISKNRTQTFQWVVGEPVYMITRPNCRHYFMGLPIKEVVSHTEDELLERHGMIHEVGIRGGMQTLRTRDILSTIDTYERRIAYFSALNEACPTQELKNAIEKNRFLVRRWKMKIKKM